MAGGVSHTGARRWIGLVPVAVFLVSSVLLLSWWAALTAAQGRAAQEHFELDAQRVEVKISERLATYKEILRGAAGLFAASDDVTREEYHRYVEALQLGRAFGEIQGIGFSIRVPAEKLEAHLRSVRDTGFPGYAIRPEGVRAEYTSVLYLEPVTERNRRAFGLDGFAEPTRRAAMELARDRGGAATTRKVILVQEAEPSQQPGILTFFPIYAGGSDPGTVELRRAALRGWVYSPLQVKEFLEKVVGRDLEHTRLEIFDGPETTSGHLLYDSRPGNQEPTELATSITLPVAPVSWTLRFTAGAPYLAGIRQRSPAVEFGFMSLIALLLTGMSAAAVVSWRARQHAVDLSRSLRESEARWRITFEHAPAGIFTVDAEDRFLRVNGRYEKITGYTAEELAHLHRSDIVHPDDRAADAEVVRKVRAGELEVGSLQRRGLRKDGTTFWADATLSLEPAGPGSSAGLIGVLEDVTARHEAEAKFREIADRSLAGILIVQDGKIAYANSLAAELVGVPAQAVVGRSADWVRERIHPDDLPNVRAAAAAAAAEVEGALRPVTYRVMSPDGVRTVEQLARPIQHLGRPATLVFVLDVTERERTEEELRKGQRLESLGIVAGGIAHDFNNLLTAVFGHVELARAQVDGGSAPALELDVALSALARSRDLTRQLLTFATGGAPARKLLQVGKLLEDAATLGLGGSSLRARLDVEPGLPPVEADEGQMSQLLNNLLVNARQATSGGGEIAIRARRRAVQEGGDPRPGSGGARRDLGPGQGARDRAGGPAQGLRPVLHHPRHRHRPGARHLVLHRQASRRTHRDRVAGRRGDDRDRAPARRRRAAAGRRAGPARGPAAAKAPRAPHGRRADGPQGGRQEPRQAGARGRDRGGRGGGGREVPERPVRGNAL